MEQEIRSQPDILARNASTYLAQAEDALQGSSYEMILIAARGSSDNAALYARYLFEIHLGVPVSLAAPSVLTRYHSKIRYPKCLAIGISQSGAAPDVAEVLLAMRSMGHDTLAITNTPNSRLTKSATHSVLLDAGEERSVAATKTYTSSLLALYQIARALGARLEQPGAYLPDEEWLQDSKEWGKKNAKEIMQASVAFALARGYSFCSAHETALKLMECALLPCKSYSIADFEHGPKALAGPGSAAIVYGEPPDGLAAQGCKILTPPKVEGPLAPIREILCGQYLALETARLKGLNPDKPVYLSKVTETL